MEFGFPCGVERCGQGPLYCKQLLLSRLLASSTYSRRGLGELYEGLD